MNHRHHIALKIDHRWGLSLFVQNLRRQCLLTNSSCILWIATVPSDFPSLSSNSTWKRQKGMRKNLLEEKLRKNLLEEKSLAKTCWRKPALTLSLASSSTSSNSSSLERGHFILSENDCRFTLCGSIYIVESTKNIRQVFIVYAEPEEAGGYYANSEVNFWFP